MFDFLRDCTFLQKEAEEAKKRKEKLKIKSAEEKSQQQQTALQNKSNEEDDDDKEDGDEDYELRLIKEQRLKQIKQAHQQKLHDIGKGHGSIDLLLM